MDPHFSESAETVQATLARVLELTGASADAQLVRMADASLVYTDHDNWRGGTNFYQLSLRVPLEVFVQIQPGIEDREKTLLEIVSGIWRDVEQDVISTVRVFPDRTGRSGEEVPAPAHALPTFWEPELFRLFVSHCSSHKGEVGQLKMALSWFGVCAFVAHDDIEPSELWQTEIERALRTSEALLAVVTSEFVQSEWCDQEVGHALGRGLVVLPVAWGATPHGFIGKIQALPGLKGEPLAACADGIVSILLKSPRTSSSMTNALVHAVAGAGSFAVAKANAAMLEQAPTLLARHAVLLRGARKDNSQVADAFGVPDRIERILLSHGLRV